jgi:hypothetical protein
MNLENLKNLPIQERIAEFKKVKEKFAVEKSKLSEIIVKLESAVKERNAFAQNISTPEKKILNNEVRALSASIKNVKARIDSKNEEMKLVEKAIAEAEQHIVESEKELYESQQKEEKTRLEQMIRELNKNNETAQIKQLEDEIRIAEIPDDVKKQIGQTTDYMKQQNENFYKSQQTQMLEDNFAGSGYKANSPNPEEERGTQITTFYQQEEKVKSKQKEMKDYYKAQND